ncbi:MAG: adenosylmethionine--8-amino-7-oxononanoate transaminase [Bdellovibrionota bacterium]|nr:MAG: adenosylmethionine--8-amino-7-oxononanoate transaminase [Pseudomonadota bacterium]
MNFQQIFITATGTDVGKTFISSLLLRSAPDWSYWKPVQTGGAAIDQNSVLEIAPAARISPLKKYEYELPASPDQAAAAEFATPPLVYDLARMARLESQMIIEGAGGLMVPLNDKNETWLDFLQETRMPVLLVATSGLGTINHTLLSIEALQSRAIPILGLVLNGPEHRGNQKSLLRFHPRIPQIIIPQLGSDTALSELDRLGVSIWRTLAIGRNEDQKSKTWLKKDKDFVWHPYTQHLTAPEPIPIVAGRGSYLFTEKGEQLFDATASWWTCNIGHGQARIGAAIKQQHARLDHCGFGNATHQPGSELAAKLIGLAGNESDLTKVFYSDNGSCAVEVAMKMAVQARMNQGKPQQSKFLYFRGAYHGDTFGAMAVADSQGFHKAFAPYVFKGIETTVVTSHATDLCPNGSKSLDEGKAKLDRLFQVHARELAAVIIEPLVQGSGGMLMQDPDWLKHLAKLCQEHSVYLILDEVFTGMGRLGSDFAYQKVGIKPDLVCLAKGLTGGSLPFAATLATTEIFSAFLSEDRSKALLHGHTFTGNPIACAAALATLEIYRELDIPARARVIEGAFQQWISENQAPLKLSSPRAMGGILAFELESEGYFSEAAYKIPDLGRRHNLLLRTLGGTVYFVPPLSTDEDQLLIALENLKQTVQDYLDAKIS